MNELTQYKERLHVALTAAKICIFEVDGQESSCILILKMRKSSLVFPENPF